MPFKIKIQEIKTTNKLYNSDWGVIADDNGKKEYGYLPPVTKAVQTDHEIYTQEVESLDLAAVISAVNNMITSTPLTVDSSMPRIVSYADGAELGILSNRVLEIVDVLDGDTLIAVEFTNGVDTWFYDMHRHVIPELRIGRVPRKNMHEEYLRVPRLKYGPAPTDH